MKLGTMPVRVRPGFFLVAAILGGREGIEGLTTWLVASFVSVLFHELGHATVGRAFGQTPSISLYEGGGLTSFAPGGRKLAAWEHIGISLAGPFAGFLLGSLVYVASPRLLAGTASPAAQRFVRDMLWCNFGWGLVNLLPVLPLDGGQVAKRLLLAIHAPTAERNARVLSVVTAAVAAAWAVMTGWWLGLAYAAWLGGPSAAALVRSRGDRAAADLLARCVDALDKGNGQGALAQAEALVLQDRDARVQAQALTLMGYALIELGRFGELEALLTRTPKGFERDPWLQGVVLLDRWEAEETAKKSLQAGFGPWIANQTLVALAKAGRKAQALRLLEAVRDRFEPQQLESLSWLTAA
jgi:Zn-dependent protease